MPLNLPHPKEGSLIEIWFKDSDQNQPGMDVIYKEGVFRSRDESDRFEDGEFLFWKYAKTPQRKPGV